jgi:uncharacterized repeat protein (TIGR01451 family)
MFQARPPRRRNCRSLRSSANQSSRFRQFALESLEPRMMLTGTWTPLTIIDPSGAVGRLVLLSDGSVMSPRFNFPDGGSQKLTPDASGNYVNGTWSPLAPMDMPRSTVIVFQDGRLLAFGGGPTNGPPTNTGEIYNPQTNTWTSIASFPESAFGLDPSMLLANGTVLVGSTQGPQTYIYDPASDTWSAGPAKLYGDSSNHESWTKLADGSILSYDVNSNPGEAQRLDPSTMTWIDSGSVPVPLEADTSPFMSMGPGVLLPDGTLLQLGRSSQTAIYTPSATPGGTGTWAAGPVIPNGLEAGGSNPDREGSSAVMMPNGHVMFSADSPGTGGSTRFFDWDATTLPTSSPTDVTPSIDQYQSLSVAYETRLLMLPNGQVLLGNVNGNGFTDSKQLYVYTPDGAPLAAGKPTITSVVANGNHSTLTGTQLNGVSAGGSLGGATSMATNYPIIELKSNSGIVYFARTFNWSSTGVQTGSTPETTDFTIPPGLPLGTYQLTVIANGIASDPVSFTGGVTGADLAVVNAGPSGSFNEGDYIPYSFTVTNNGPSAATKVVLTDTLGANLAFNSASESQGSYKRSGSVVTFSLGTIAVGQTVNVTVYAQATEDGNLSNTAVASSNVSDPNSLNNTAVNTVAVAEPPIVVSSPISVSGKKVNFATVATFTHANGVEPASAFIATIDWGDGTTSTGTISLSRGTYYVQGSHTYSMGGSHTVTTTVAESGSGGAMLALTMMSTDNASSTSTSDTPAIVQSQTNAALSAPPSLKTTAVDQVYGTSTVSRSRRALHATADEAEIDDLFALV